MHAPPETPHPYDGDDLSRIEQLGEAYERSTFGSDRSGRVRYAFNTLGVRGDEFDPAARHRVFCFGESHAMGAGVDHQQAWPARLCSLWASSRGLDRGEVCMMNFAEGAASNGYIARTLMTQCERVRPDVALIHFADYRRSEGHMFGRPIRVGRWIEEDEANEQVRAAAPGSERRRALDEWQARGRSYLRFRTDAFDAAETLRNILLGQFYCRARGIRAIASCDRLGELDAAVDDTPSLAPSRAMVDPGFLAPVGIGGPRPHDLAADGRHPGAGAHDALARAMLEFLDRIEREPERVGRASPAPVVFVFGADEGDGGDPGRPDGWPARLAAGWAMARGMAPGQLPCVAHVPPRASNAQIARLVLTECERRRPALVLVEFAPHDRAEGFAAGEPFPIGPWLLAPEHRRAVRAAPRASELRPRLLEQLRRGADYHEFATEALGGMETLRNILLVQFYCAARGIPALARCRTSARLVSDEALQIESLARLIAIVDPAFAVDFGDPELRAVDGHRDADRVARRMLGRTEGTAAG